MNLGDFPMKKTFTTFKYVLLVILFSVLFCLKSYAQVPQPCTPDCESTPFSTPTMTPITLPGGCELHVWWSSRKACNMYWDVQIVMIETIGADCWRWLPLSKLFKEAYYNLIKLNPMGYPPKYPVQNPPGIECETQWRISQASCWTNYEIIIVGVPHTVSVQCLGTDCCLQQMKICRETNPIPYGTITITPLGDPYSDNDCSYSTLPPGVPPNSICEPICNWYLYHEGGIINPNNEDKSDSQISIRNEFATLINDGLMPISFVTKDKGEYLIRLSDPYGNYHREFQGKYQIGKTDVLVNLIDLPKGNYIYTVILNGAQLMTNKLIIE